MAHAVYNGLENIRCRTKVVHSGECIVHNWGISQYAW